MSIDNLRAYIEWEADFQATLYNVPNEYDVAIYGISEAVARYLIGRLRQHADTFEECLSHTTIAKIRELADTLERELEGL